MRSFLSLVVILTLTTAGCARIADSRLNPLNWFGPSQAAVPLDATGQPVPLVPQGALAQVVDGRVLIDQVTSLEIARTPSGAIVRATGIADGQGQFNAQLVPVGYQNGTLTLAFRVERPQGLQPGGSDASRTITVARLLTADELASVRSIQVQGARNARVSRR